jgi:hypothetical protein
LPVCEFRTSRQALLRKLSQAMDAERGMSVPQSANPSSLPLISSEPANAHSSARQSWRRPLSPHCPSAGRIVAEPDSYPSLLTVGLYSALRSGTEIEPMRSVERSSTAMRTLLASGGGLNSFRSGRPLPAISRQTSVFNSRLTVSSTPANSLPVSVWTEYTICRSPTHFLPCCSTARSCESCW